VGGDTLGDGGLDTGSADLGLCGIGQLLDLNVVGGLGDGLVLEVDMDLVGSEGGCLIVSSVGSVSVVLQGDLLLSGGSGEVCLEGSTSRRDLVAIRVDRLDGEVGGVVLGNTRGGDTGTADGGLRGVDSGVNVDLVG